jgi:hypothetical protein
MPRGRQVRENETGRGGRVLLGEEEYQEDQRDQNLNAGGPMYRNLHLEASARMALARKTMRSLREPTMSVSGASTARNLSSVTAAILIHSRHHV